MVGIFLIVPTVPVITRAGIEDGRFSLARLSALFAETALTALGRSVFLSGSTALLGAVVR